MVSVGLRSLVCFALVFSLLLESTFEQSPSLSSATDRAALLELRSSLGLRARDWPIKSDPCTAWNGVNCSSGRVVGVNVSGFRRTRVGAQNPRFSVGALLNLTQLVSFNASNFALPGAIPDWFGERLVSLRVLDLSSCSVNGVIPESIGNLTNLVGLYLGDNGLTGSVPSSLGQLVSLSVLDFSRNSLSGLIPSSLGFLRKLSVLDISSNLLSGSIPPGFGNLSELGYLNLSSNRLSSAVPAQLGDLASLVDLDLSFNSLSGSLPEDLSGLRSLKRLIVGNNLLDGSLPDNVFSVSALLEFVVLGRNNFTGALPEVLWSMPGLRVLDIAINSFTGALPESSFNGDASSARLNISRNMFYGSLTLVVRRFSVVDLSGNYFQGKVPEFSPSNASLTSNCLQTVSEQRTAGECASFYTERGLIFDNFGLQNSENSRRKWIILGGVLGGFVLIVILASVLSLLLCCARKKNTTNQKGAGVGVGIGPAQVGSSPAPARVSINFLNLGDVFTYQQLMEASNYLDDANLIKHGHSGTLFRGVLENGTLVVIKKIDLDGNKREACLLECDFFSKVSNSRFVPLLGHCLENENEKFLVYRYMPNEDLSRALLRKGNSVDDTLQSLDWITRLKIAIGAAEGLSYLHHECNPPIVHRDVQASSILLDDKFEVRLGSLSEFCTQEGDTNNSMITRLLRKQQSFEPSTSGSQTASCAYDVYCFGKVLLELVTGKLGISTSSDAQMKEWFDQILPYISIYDREFVTKIVDPSLIVDEDLLEEVWAMAIVARSCLNPKPTRRPLMRYILKALENPLKVVREESSSSARLRTTSSRGSWNSATLFTSWRHSSTEVGVIPGGKLERWSIGSSGSAQIGGGDRLSSRRRRQWKEICPEPSNEPDVERDPGGE